MKLPRDFLNSLAWDSGYSWVYERWGCTGLVGLTLGSFVLFFGIAWLVMLLIG